MGGGNTPSNTNVISYRLIATLGDYADFGDLNAAVGQLGAASDSHGGLQG